LQLSINANKDKYEIQSVVAKQGAAKSKVKILAELTKEKAQKEKQLEKLEGTIRVKKEAKEAKHNNIEKDEIKRKVLQEEISKISKQLRKKTDIQLDLIEPLLILRASHLENLLRSTASLSIHSPQDHLRLYPSAASNDRFIERDIKEEKAPLPPLPIDFGYIKESKEDKEKSQICISFPQDQPITHSLPSATTVLSELKNSPHGGLSELIKQAKGDFEVISVSDPVIIRVNARIRSETLTALMEHYSRKMRAPVELSDDSYL
jgi:hypothetical protein